MSMPGIKRRVAWTLVAEIGTDMQVFPSPAHIASWVRLCPGRRSTRAIRVPK
jgi:transposase